MTSAAGWPPCAMCRRSRPGVLVGTAAVESICEGCFVRFSRWLEGAAAGDIARVWVLEDARSAATPPPELVRRAAAAVDARTDLEVGVELLGRGFIFAAIGAFRCALVRQPEPDVVHAALMRLLSPKLLQRFGLDELRGSLFPG